MIHQRILSGEKPFKCDHCDESFFQNITLVYYQKTQGKKTLKYIIILKIIFKSNLVSNQKVHNGEKPYKCH